VLEQLSGVAVPDLLECAAGITRLLLVG